MKISDEDNDRDKLKYNLNLLCGNYSYKRRNIRS